MSQLAIWAELEAKPGKEQEVANFLKAAQSMAEREPGTITWYAMRLGGTKFGIFDTFVDEKARETHVSGELARSLFSKSKELFVKDPQIHKLDLLGSKVPTAVGVKAHSA